MQDATTTRRNVLLGSTFAALPSEFSKEAAAKPASAVLAARANYGTVGVISGGVDGTYIRIAADLATVLDDGDNLRVLPVVGKGSVQNLSDLVYLHGIDIAIMQSDALAFVVSENMFPGVISSVRYVAKLYDEEVHILARGDITRLEDCAGQKVNFDVPGSGTGVTASLLFSKLGIAIEPTYLSQENALKSLSDGDIAALVYVAGQPTALFKPLAAGSKLHFLTVPLSAGLIDTYLPARLVHASYPGLIPDQTPVETVAVGAVMAAYGSPPGTDRYRRIEKFVTSLSNNFAQLLKSPRHPKWREVNLRAEVPGWTRFTLRPPSVPALGRL